MFKVGDRVTHSMQKVPGTVVRLDKKGDTYYVMFDGLVGPQPDGSWRSYSGSMKLVPPRPKYWIGDKVRGSLSGRQGEIVGVCPKIGTVQKYIVDWGRDNRLTENEEYLLQVESRPTAPTGSDMTMIESRKWETSYTKKVVDDLQRALPYWRLQSGAPVVELLTQYWNDLHIPYQQRDTARAEAKRLDEVCSQFRKELSAQDLELQTLRAEIAALKAAPKSTLTWDIYPGEGKSTRDRRNLLERLKMAHGAAAYHNMYSAMSAIDDAIKALDIK